MRASVCVCYFFKWTALQINKVPSFSSDSNLRLFRYMRLLTKDCNSISFAQEDTTVLCGHGGTLGAEGWGPCCHRVPWGPGQRGLHPAEELCSFVWAALLFPCSASPSPLVQPSFPPRCCMVIKWHQPAPRRLLIILQTGGKVWGVYGSWKCWQGRPRVVPCFCFGLIAGWLFYLIPFHHSQASIWNQIGAHESCR